MRITNPVLVCLPGFAVAVSELTVINFVLGPKMHPNGLKMIP